MQNFTYEVYRNSKQQSCCGTTVLKYRQIHGQVFWNSLSIFSPLLLSEYPVPIRCILFGEWIWFFDLAFCPIFTPAYFLCSRGTVSNSPLMPHHQHYYIILPLYLIMSSPIIFVWCTKVMPCIIHIWLWVPCKSLSIHLFVVRGNHHSNVVWFPYSSLVSKAWTRSFICFKFLDLSALHVQMST